MTESSLATHGVFNSSAPFADAELFALTRLAATHAGMYGAVDLESGDMRALLERALP
jgi:putative acyl-CoA dehydrogenase